MTEVERKVFLGIFDALGEQNDKMRRALMEIEKNGIKRGAAYCVDVSHSVKCCAYDPATRRKEDDAEAKMAMRRANALIPPSSVN